MEMTAFRVQMFKNVADSGWVDVGRLNVVVGKNEAGKTSTLRALHKFNPHSPEPYDIAREWPRGRRRERTEGQVVCSVKFLLSQDEVEELAEIAATTLTCNEVVVTKDYGGRFEVDFPNGLFPDKLHPNDIDEICNALLEPAEPVGEGFRAAAQQCRDEVRRLAHEGRFADFAGIRDQSVRELQAAFTPGNPQPQHANESNFVNVFSQKLQGVATNLSAAPSIQKQAHEFVVSRLPTFIYMDEYRAFQGSAYLDQVKQRVDANRTTEDDKSLLMIMRLAGLNLNDEVQKAQAQDREQRQYDLDDAAASLTREIEDRWRQRKYQVQFRADGNAFYTMVEDEHRTGLIRLDERSKGFQWFFSFDLMFMHESAGTFSGCVLLLDEPGLHLHPEAQRDLLRRLEAYSENNTLIYSTHLPFMIDLRHPDRIKVISETVQGAVITDDLSSSQPEAKLTLQAALGMSGRTSYLVANQNLVVEGVDDFWIVTELSNLLHRSGGEGLPEDLHVTASGGASEAAYIATLMIGQNLDVVVLLDSDGSGEQAAGKLIKNWLNRYRSSRAEILMLGQAVGSTDQMAIEDLFPDAFYVELVQEVCGRQLAAAGVTELVLPKGGMLVKRVERAFAEVGLPYNKGPVAKRLRMKLSRMKSADDLPTGTREKAEALLRAIREAMPVGDHAVSTAATENDQVVSLTRARGARKPNT